MKSINDQLTNYLQRQIITPLHKEPFPTPIRAVGKLQRLLNQPLWDDLAISLDLRLVDITSTS